MVNRHTTLFLNTTFGMLTIVHVYLPNWFDMFCQIANITCDNFSFRSPLMKTLDWSVQMLDRECSSTWLCIHFYKTRVASET